MRYVLALITVLVVAGLAGVTTPCAAPGAGTPMFVLTGGGWGHNVGLSQWGAYGQAMAGRTYDRILRHYFAGTTLTPSPIKTVRVLVADGRASAAIGSTQALSVRDAAGVVHRLARTDVRLAGGPLRLRELLPGATAVAPPVAKVVKLSLPLTFLPPRGETLTLDGKGFRGRLVVSRAAKRLRVVMEVGLDAYVMGIVPGEMPKEWPLEALKAQAVAARTYAVAGFERGKDWDVVADPVNFAYYGVERESASTTQAVLRTRGQVLTYGGKVITAFYFSSSGGRTLSSQDVFGVALPYLPGAPDPWDEPSPHHRWEPRTFTPATLGSALGIAGAVRDVQVVPSGPGRPLGLRVVSTGGETVVRASDVRARLGLKSPNFSLGVLRLEPAPPPAVAGSRVAIDGLARGVGPAVIERRGPGGVWKPAKKVALRPDGSFSVALRPAATSVYRITAAGLIGPSVVVEVTARTAS